jgi:hypothetical protein
MRTVNLFQNSLLAVRAAAEPAHFHRRIKRLYHADLAEVVGRVTPCAPVGGNEMTARTRGAPYGASFLPLLPKEERAGVRSLRAQGETRSMFGVRCWMFDVPGFIARASINSQTDQP